MLRYLNMFVIIGLILIGVSLAGFATSDRFLMEPGQVHWRASVAYLFRCRRSDDYQRPGVHPPCAPAHAP